MKQRKRCREPAATATSGFASRGASALGLAIGIGLGLVIGQAAAQPFADAAASAARYTRATAEPRLDCSELATLTLRDIVSITATQIPAQGNVPAHCRVAGLLDPEIAFEVNLPARWNERFYMIGNGGLAGEAHESGNRPAQRASALEHGFVMAMTNTGHDSTREPSGTFVLSNPQKAIDYAYRAVHLTAVTAKEIANRYYGRPVEYSYWNSCSNGGRQGLIEAQRYPGDFDGVVANAPWVDQTGFAVGALWNQRALSEAPVTPAKLSLVADRVMAACDVVDGLEDGLIDDPRNCAFDVRTQVPACPVGVDDASCLTPAQADAIAKVYSGPVSNGEPYFPGFELGSEAIVTNATGGASGWMNLIVPAQPTAKPADFNLAEGLLRYLVFVPPQPDYDYREFDFDRDVGLLTQWGALANADNPDLSAFRDRGGKLIMTYGWADAILQPRMGVDYYEEAVAVNGPDTPEFFRLFMAPGMAHCAGGIGPDQMDPVTAIIDWVEEGKAPDSLLAKKLVNGEVTRSRPLCPYPQVARYDGSGSIDDAENFSCTAP